MPFQAATLDNIMGILNLPVSAPAWVQHTQAALDRVANYGGETAIARVEGYVIKFQAAETAKSEASADAYMVRADVVEWQAGGQTKGFADDMSYYREKILAALFLPQEQREIRRMGGGGGNRISNLR